MRVPRSCSSSIPGARCGELSPCAIAESVKRGQYDAATEGDHRVDEIDEDDATRRPVEEHHASQRRQVAQHDEANVYRADSR